jgi:hypothetical protein
MILKLNKKLPMKKLSILSVAVLFIFMLSCNKSNVVKEIGKDKLEINKEHKSKIEESLKIFKNRND